MIYSKEQARLNLIAAVRLIGKYFALKYDPDQPRDEAGRWSDEGGGGGGDNQSGASSGGSGGGSGLSKTSPERVKAIANETGISDDKIRILPNGERINARGDSVLADYNQATGEITVYKIAMEEDEQTVKGILSHEYTHSVYDTCWNAREAEYSLSDLRYDFKDKYGKEFTSVLYNLDGISDYSKYIFESATDQHLKFKETIAEVGRLYSSGQKDSIPDEWKYYYEGINKVYGTIKK